MLEQSGITHYLLSLGLVKPQSVVDGGLTVVDASRRNSVFLVAGKGEATYVVKQAGPRTATTVAHEAAMLRALMEEPSVSSHVPRVVHYDSEAAHLVLQTPSGAKDWSDHHGQGRYSPLLSRGLARTLAALHRLPVAAVSAAPAGVDAMWGLSLPEPPRDLLLHLSATAQDLVARVQASAETCEALARVRDEPVDPAPVHGDLRWTNCLALAAPGARRRTRTLVIDWELAGTGPPAYDVGAVLAEYLVSWVGSIPIIEPADPARLVAHARHPLRAMRPAMQAFWAAYRTANPQSEPLQRVVELAAVWLLQAAIERAQLLSAPSAHVVTLLQLADNLLQRPQVAAVNLLGLHE